MNEFVSFSSQENSVFKVLKKKTQNRAVSVLLTPQLPAVPPAVPAISLLPFSLVSADRLSAQV